LRPDQITAKRAGHQKSFRKLGKNWWVPSIYNPLIANPLQNMHTNKSQRIPKVLYIVLDPP
jgi:hypothetical protein